MTTIQNTRELPRDLLRCFAVTNAQARGIDTQYQVSWFYPLNEERGYLYVLNSEYE
jgi:formylmethanofuran dehydrogenase subunit E-like metal-binding protein